VSTFSGILVYVYFMYIEYNVTRIFIVSHCKIFKMFIDNLSFELSCDLIFNPQQYAYARVSHTHSSLSLTFVVSFILLTCIRVASVTR
jgi:hypothetical protein